MGVSGAGEWTWSLGCLHSGRGSSRTRRLFHLPPTPPFFFSSPSHPPLLLLFFNLSHELLNTTLPICPHFYALPLCANETPSSTPPPSDTPSSTLQHCNPDDHVWRERERHPRRRAGRGPRQHGAPQHQGHRQQQRGLLQDQAHHQAREAHGRLLRATGQGPQLGAVPL
ncbi:SUMO protein smt3 [Fusarium falciforme]|nr:SUMO protein smt3 [Fusarium falciforme]